MLLIVKTLKWRRINFKNEKLIKTFIVHTSKLRATDMCVQYTHVKGKGKVIPLQARYGPEGV